eukprot:scaffold38313_cov24-Prasinocladus_malaysianus.AAC.1
MLSSKRKQQFTGHSRTFKRDARHGKDELRWRDARFRSYPFRQGVVGCSYKAESLDKRPARTRTLTIPINPRTHD